MIHKLIVAILFIAALCVRGEAAGTDKPLKVVATIQPLHSLVSGVMEGVGEPDLLVQGGGSPHAYTLRPSQAAALQRADVVFWIGEDMETFLTKPLQALPQHAEVVALDKAPGMTLLPYREGGMWERHAHSGESDEVHEAGHVHDHDETHDDEDHEAHHEKHGSGEDDMHIWLDPANAKAMVARIVAGLSNVDPGNAARYQTNGAQLTEQLTELDAELGRELKPFQNRPYIVFHDAYQYFDNRYGLTPVGSITVSPDRKPSAKRLFDIRKKIRATGAACVFSEPQFEPAVVQTVIEGIDVRTGTLDPLGSDLRPGADAYFILMRDLSKSLSGCLG